MPVQGGAAAARNAGLRAARGSYVTFLDDDDALTPDRLALALAGLARAPIAVCWRGALAPSPAPPTWHRSLDGDVRDRIVEAPVPHVGQTAVRRSIAPMFDERFTVSEDVEWWIRLAAAAPVTTVPRVGYLLRDHPGPRQTARTAARLECRLLLLETHAPYFDSRPRAASYQWSRAGGMAQRLGDHATARAAFRRSLALRPRPATAWHLLRSVRPSGVRLQPDEGDPQPHRAVR
jgi:hypothetical protein